MEDDHIHSPTLRQLRHIAIWERSSKLCKLYHPGKPPCFFPSQFSSILKPQSLQQFPVFVQQCPSSSIYLAFSKQRGQSIKGSTNSIEHSRYDKVPGLEQNVLAASFKDQSFHSETSHTTLSSIYSESPTPQLTSNSPVTSNYYSQSLETNLRHTSFEGDQYSSAKQTHLPQEYFLVSNLNIDQWKWDLTGSCHKERFTEEITELIMLVVIEIHYWNHLTYLN